MNINAVMAPIIVMGGLVFIIILFACTSSKRKKIIINETVSKEYQEKAYEILQNNPKVSIARFRHKLMGLLIFMLLITSGLCGYLYFTGRAKILLIGGIVSFVAMIVVMIMRNSKSLYNDVIPEIIKGYKNDLTYEHKNGIGSHIYADAGFGLWDTYHSEDLIKGKIHECPFSMAEVHTQDRYTDSDGDTHYRTLFRGTFAVIDLNKDFGSWVNIVNNKIKIFSRDNYISLENTDFENIYDVFTGDKIKAMRLLTPDVTTRMIDIYNETGLYFEIKIVNKIMYIRLYTSALFELGFSNPLKESKRIGSCMAVIDSVFKITENFINELERLDD